MSTTVQAPTAFEPMSQPSLVALVEASIRSAVLEGRLRPGTRVSDATIATEMGISRSPVREAIRHLAARGLLREEPRRGAFVTTLTRSAVSQVYDCRRALEGLAARRIAASPDTENHVAALRSIVAEMESAKVRRDPARMAEADHRFHLTLCELTANAWLIRLYEQIADQSRLMQAVDMLAHAERETADIVLMHEPIVEALATGDPDAAERAAINHIDVSERLFLTEVPDIEDA